ncbi:transposase [Streptomyces sp. CLV115]|uniref:transposase n=1 Tax=Streptomyces sp. CLV115 TaxID=3138502 RepID=UPI00406D32DE
MPARDGAGAGSRPYGSRSPGPRTVDDRRCLQGILLVLYTGITWQQLPLELAFGPGRACWRQPGWWQEARAVRAAVVHRPAG